MIKAIETKYDGRHFRSRAEARWAVFFKALKIPYEYEPEGFVLPDGRRYLPDFRLQLMSGGKLRDFWVEVKPAQWNDDGKMEIFAKTLQPWQRATVLPSIDSYKTNPYDLWVWFHEHGDTGHCFCTCPSCGAVGFEFSGEYDRLGCCQSLGSGRKKKSVEVALDLALSERFGT
jgi:hypothetical protein